MLRIFWKGKQLPATRWPSLFRILSRSSLHLGRKSQELSSMFSWRNIRTYPSQTLALAKYPPNQLQPLNRSFLPFQTKLLVMQISGSRLNSKVDEIFWNMLMSYWTFLPKAPWNEFPSITTTSQFQVQVALLSVHAGFPAGRGGEIWRGEVAGTVVVLLLSGATEGHQPEGVSSSESPQNPTDGRNPSKDDTWLHGQ